jgi:uncharacterized damage-inducible protein DinB
MNEKEMFLQAWEREFQTTLKVLKGYPKEKLDLKPAERSRTAKDLLWTFVVEEKVVDGVVKGQVDFMNMPKPPATLGEIVSAYEATHREMGQKLKALTDQEFNTAIPFMVAPKQMGKVRRGDILWMMLMDSVHHRGQLSVYLRVAGAKVPSIYGPSADEPWM